MATNIEIKARVRDVDSVAAKAEGLSDSRRAVIQQEDVFFHTPTGRLKLRIFSPDRAELIFYERPDAEGPKASHYEIARTAEPGTLRRVLAASLGERGVVRKTRWLYLAGRTRIHIDRVEGLGEFMELEVVLRPGEDPEDGARTARVLMEQLGVSDDDLVQGAYIDLLAK